MNVIKPRNVMFFFFSSFFFFLLKSSPCDECLGCLTKYRIPFGIVLFLMETNFWVQFYASEINDFKFLSLLITNIYLDLFLQGLLSLNNPHAIVVIHFYFRSFHKFKQETLLYSLHIFEHFKLCWWQVQVRLLQSPLQPSEVYNRGFWHTSITCNFSIYKRMPANFKIFTYTLKYLYDPNSY